MTTLWLAALWGCAEQTTPTPTSKPPTPAPPAPPPDRDGDGYAVDVDCNDIDPEVHPGAPEVCDGIDNNCDGAVDDEDPGLDLSQVPLWFADFDGDGFGQRDDPPLQQCSEPSLDVDYVLSGGDCDDFDPLIHPGATEICDDDRTDEDCSGAADDADPGLDLSTADPYVIDGDGDGFGDDSIPPFLACHDPSTEETTYVLNARDCDDSNPKIHPFEQEICDTQDNDCDGVVDLWGSVDVCVQVVTTEPVGGDGARFGGSAMLVGNQFSATNEGVLLAYAAYVEELDCDLDFYVYESDRPRVTPEDVVWSGSITPRRSSGWMESGTVDWPLTPGLLYTLSVAWTCDALYDINPSAAWTDIDLGWGRTAGWVRAMDYGGPKVGAPDTVLRSPNGAIAQRVTVAMPEDP